MQIIQPEVGREAIDASIRAARFEGHDPARWALPLVAEADRRCSGSWTLVAFTPEEARALWLPAHAGEPCHGDSEALAGGEGGSVERCARWLVSHAGTYARHNASCWSRISRARESAWEPLVVAPFPVGDRVGPPGTALIVIDGLHRALGWALREQPGTLRAFLAGPEIVP
jgi:hypothetical protein